MTEKVQFSPASAYYLDTTNNDELEIEKSNRKDIYGNLSKDIDIDVVCEDVIHHKDTEGITIQKILETSRAEIMRIEDSIGKYINFIKETFAKIETDLHEFPTGVYNAKYNRVSLTDYINSETKFSRELDKVSSPKRKFNMVEKHCIDIIYELRAFIYGRDNDITNKKRIEKEIDKLVLNIRNFKYATGVKNLNDIYTRLLSIDTLTISHITVHDNNLQSAKDTVENLEHNITSKKMLHELYKIINDNTTLLTYEKKVEEIKQWNYIKELSDDNLERTMAIERAVKRMKSSFLPVAYSTYNGARPSEEYGDFEYWNGFQAFDLDIKECSDKVMCPYRKKKIVASYHHTKEDIDEMKHKMHETLSKYSWYLCTKTSMSGRGLHILTKVKPFHHIYKDADDNRNNNFTWFTFNYYQKYSIIRWILLHECGIPETFINLVIDNSMNNISQGIVLNSDVNSLWNDKFIDLPLLYGFDIPPKEGMLDEEWILDKDNLKKMLSKKSLKASGHDSLSPKTNTGGHTVSSRDYDTISYVFTSANIDSVDNVTPIDETKFEAGKRDFMRMKVLRTMIFIYGHGENTTSIGNPLYKVCAKLLKCPESYDPKEFIGKWNYAVRRPFVFDDTLVLLRACGLTFDIDSETLNTLKDTKLNKANEALRDSDVTFDEIIPDYSFTLNGVENSGKFDEKGKPRKEYLGDQSTQILKSFVSDKINVLEAAPNTGKTTMFNNMARNSRVCLVIPYTSILKSKILEDEESNQLFDTFFGEGEQGRIKFGSGKSIATTYDKFNFMTEDEYKLFDYIAIDESHLLFTQTFRGDTITGVISHTNKFISNEMSKKESIQFDIGMTSSSGNILDGTSLFKTMSNTGTKIIMMTGTITGELLYLKDKGILNYVKINSSHEYGKHAEIILTDTRQNAELQISKLIADSIIKGKTVICPTNKGDGYVQSIIAQVNLILKDKKLSVDNWAVYRKDNEDHPVCVSINKNSQLLPDLKLLFCTLYLGVGVDIKSDRDYQVVIDGDNTTAQDIEQYNNRIRKSKINCSIVYCAIVNTLSGLTEIKKSIYSTPSQIELEDVSNYTDEIYSDMVISKANKFASKGDDNLKMKLVDNISLESVYHDYTENGVEFNEDKFAVYGFARNYLKTACGAAYSKYVLSTYYGYTISYKLFMMDTEELNASMLKVGKDAKRQDILEKTEAFVKTIDFVSENWDAMKEVSKFRFDSLHTDVFDIIIEPFEEKKRNAKGSDETHLYVVKYPKRFESKVKDAYYKMRRLLRVYDIKTAGDILKSNITNSGTIQESEMRRDMRLINFIEQSRNNKLWKATSNVFQIIDDFVNDPNENVIFTSGTSFTIDEFAFRNLCESIIGYSEEYFRKMSEDEKGLSDDKTSLKLMSKTLETIRTVFKYRKNKNGEFPMKYRTVPEFNSPTLDANTMFDEILHNFISGGIKVSSDVIEEVEFKEIEEQTKYDFTQETNSEGIEELHSKVNAMRKEIPTD